MEELVNSCPICEKHQKDNLYLITETEYFKIYHGPLESQMLGYIYIEPKRHVESWSQLSNQELSEFTLNIKKIEILLTEVINAERIYTVTISDVVRHLHLHIIPRVFEQGIRGLALIEQVTQHKFVGKETLLQEEILDFISSARKFITKIYL